MRRRLEVFIPIVLLAIMVQLVAPIVAFRIVANAASDPLAMATICSQTAASEGDVQTPPSAPAHHLGKCCTVCATGHGGGLTLDPSLPVFAVLQRAYHRVAWLHASEAMPPLRVGSNAQARAPPAFS